MLGLLVLSGVCVLIGLMGRNAMERVLVSLILGWVVAPVAIILMELWNSEHSGPQIFREFFTYIGAYWPLLVGLTAVMIFGSLLVGLARKYVMKDVG